MTISPGESQFSKIHFSMAETNDFGGAAQFGGGDTLKTRNRNMRTLENREDVRQGGTNESDVAVEGPVHGGFAEKADRRVAILESFERRGDFGDLGKNRADLCARAFALPGFEQAFV